MGACFATDTGNHVGGFAEIGASLHGVGLGEVVLYEAEADVVAHLVELLVHFGVVAVKVLAELGDDGAVRERHELGVDFVDAGSLSSW